MRRIKSKLHIKNKGSKRRRRGEGGGDHDDHDVNAGKNDDGDAHTVGEAAPAYPRTNLDPSLWTL